MAKPVSVIDQSLPSAVTRGVRRRFARGVRGGLDLLFPPGCTVCSRDFGDDTSELEQYLRICQECREQLVRSTGRSCSKCGVTLPGVQESEAHCPSCRDHRYRFRETVSAGLYSQELREAVLRIKHAAEHALTVSLARLLSHEAATRIATWRIDAVAGVPMHRFRRWQRGANHAEVIAEETARQLRLRFADGLLVRRRNTKPQADLAPSRRAANVRRAMRLSRSYSLTAARILLIDDIMTTGATCNEAARVLLDAGASEVFVAVLARADAPT